MTDALRALAPLVAENERLREELDAANNVLVFADGNVLSWNRQYGDYDFVLADLYAEDCEWAQQALARAGCHPRGRFLSRESVRNQEPT